MGIADEFVTGIIGTPTNFVGEVVFYVGMFFLAYLLVAGIILVIVRVLGK